MARPFTVIGFTMFFTLALVFELGQKAAVVILSAAATAFIFSLFFKSVRRDFVIPTACITARSLQCFCLLPPHLFLMKRRSVLTTACIP